MLESEAIVHQLVPLVGKWVSFLSWTLVASVVASLLVRQMRSWNKVGSAFDRLPGPRRYPLGGFLNLLDLMDNKKVLPKLRQWRKEYGPLMRLQIGPMEEVVIASPAHIQKLCLSTDVAHLVKPWGLECAKPVTWFDGLFHSKGHKWKGRRKLINPIMSHRNLVSYLDIFNEEGRKAVSHLEAAFGDGSGDPTPKPIQSILFASALNSIFRAAFGTDVDRGDLDYSTESILEAFRHLHEIALVRMSSPWLMLDSVFRFHPLSKDLAAVFKLTTKLVKQLKDKVEAEGIPSMEESSKGQSMLVDLVRAGLDFDGIYEEVVTMIIAGYETTGGALHHLLFLLALHPSIQRKCREEVDAVFDNEQLTTPNGDPSYDGVKALEYLEMCGMEALRMLPVTPGFVRKIEAPLRLSEELELPPGTTIMGAGAVVHMDPEIYPNPEIYDPNRFSPEERKKRHPYAFIPFSGGPRICIGHKFAMIELVALSARILRHFEISTTDRFEDVVLLPGITIVPEKAMNFVLTKRPEI